jgi:hypothetical protein
MNTQRMFGILALLTLVSVVGVHAQKSTERFIPVGKSPGISGKYTSIGTIDAVDMDQRTLTCTDSTGTIMVKVDKNTKIWVDRSKQKLPNLKGSLDDCHQGQVVEVKYRNNERQPGAAADWIKIQPLGTP